MFVTDTVWEFKIAGRIKFGINAVQELKNEIENIAGTNIILITDEGIKKAGILDCVKDILKDQKIFIYDKVAADPDLKNFEEALGFSKKNKGEIFIGLGGGSSIDIAKVVSVVAMYGGEIRDYIAPPNGEGKSIKGNGFPMIAIPTTSGTGSEVSPVAVLTLSEKELKVGISSQQIRPDLAIVDPVLTVSVPPHITASTGIDALSHAIESYATKRFDQKEKPNSAEERIIYGGADVFTDLFAEKSIELIAQNLRKAFNNGQNLEARKNMSLASLMAGISFTNAGLGLVHALSFSLGGKFHAPHGVSIAATLPAVMEFNAASNFKIYKKIAFLMGGNIQNLSEREAALRSAKAVRELCADVNIPNISSFGVKREHLPLIARDTMKIQRLLSGNPRLASEEDVLRVCQNAFAG